MGGFIHVLLVIAIILVWSGLFRDADGCDDFGLRWRRCGVWKGGEKMAKDPVCGMEMHEKKAPAKSRHMGKTYYFCAPLCTKAFDEDPTKDTGTDHGIAACQCGTHLNFSLTGKGQAVPLNGCWTQSVCNHQKINKKLHAHIR